MKKLANIDWTDGYLVSDKGEVFSLYEGGGRRRNKRKVQLRKKGWVDGDGYRHVSLGNGIGGRKRFAVHQLVALTFVGERPTPLHEVRHLDGNPSNNSYKNLAWGTRLDNALDKVGHGKSTYGQKNVKAKLTSKQVAQIRSLCARNIVKMRIAEKFGISSAMVSKIALGQSWAREPPETMKDPGRNKNAEWPQWRKKGIRRDAEGRFTRRPQP